ncbi:MAG: hypothetical protein HY897_02920 [Deltaproteobacteria bacterium]|nr:hypothetical protein [Deltaproteobacteria bacterium]
MTPQKKRISVALVAIAAIFVPGDALADGHGGAHEGGGFGYFLTGWQRVFMGELKTAVSEAGYPPISDNFATFGGGGHALIRDFFIVGGEGAGLVSGETSRGNYRVSLGGGYGFFNIGAVVHRRGELRIYPLLGFGGGGLSLSITDTRGATFSDVLRNPARSTTVSNGSFLLQGAMGIDYLLNFSHEPSHAGGILVGLRAGYVVNPLGSYMGWDSDGAPLSGAPADVFHGPYVRLLIGGGGHGPEDERACGPHDEEAFEHHVGEGLKTKGAEKTPGDEKKGDQGDPEKKTEPKPADK